MNNTKIGGVGRDRGRGRGRGNGRGRGRGRDNGRGRGRGNGSLLESVHMNEVLIHFNYFKQITMGCNLKNINKFILENNLYKNNNVYELSFSKELIEAKIKGQGQGQGEGIRYIEINDENIYKSSDKYNLIYFRLILFITKSDGTLLDEFYYGLKFNKNFKKSNLFSKNYDGNNIKKIDELDTYNYYVLNDTGYPFFLINNNHKDTHTIDKYTTGAFPDEYEINQVIDYLKKPTNVSTKYNMLLENNHDKDTPSNNEHKIKVDTLDLLIYDYTKGTTAFTVFHLNFTEPYDNLDNEKHIHNIVKMFCNSFKYYENKNNNENKPDNNTKILEVLNNLKYKIKQDKYKTKIYEDFFKMLLEPSQLE